MEVSYGGCFHHIDRIRIDPLDISYFALSQFVYVNVTALLTTAILFIIISLSGWLP